MEDKDKAERDFFRAAEIDRAADDWRALIEREAKK